MTDPSPAASWQSQRLPRRRRSQSKDLHSTLEKEGVALLPLETTVTVPACGQFVPLEGYEDSSERTSTISPPLSTILVIRDDGMTVVTSGHRPAEQVVLCGLLFVTKIAATGPTLNMDSVMDLQGLVRAMEARVARIEQKTTGVLSSSQRYATFIPLFEPAVHRTRIQTVASFRGSDASTCVGNRL